MNIIKSAAVLLCACFLMTACTSQKTCKYEKEYNQVADSLRAVLKNDNRSPLNNQQMSKDFAELGCADFQEKYKLNDHNLQVAIQSVRTSISLLDAFRSIEKNIKRVEENEYSR